MNNKFRHIVKSEPSLKTQRLYEKLQASIKPPSIQIESVDKITFKAKVVGSVKIKDLNLVISHNQIVMLERAKCDQSKDFRKAIDKRWIEIVNSEQPKLSKFNLKFKHISKGCNFLQNDV